MKRSGPECAVAILAGALLAGALTLCAQIATPGDATGTQLSSQSKSSNPIKIQGQAPTPDSGTSNENAPLLGPADSGTDNKNAPPLGGNPPKTCQDKDGKATPCHEMPKPHKQVQPDAL